ncbi:MAG TPA: hypothetical protein VM260_09825 [Pirellula sp.]|nr:hypothetical protein [Pirellula sp.]
MQLSENSIFSELTSAFAKELQSKLRQVSCESALFSDEGFSTSYRSALETAVDFANLLREIAGFIDTAIDKNVLLWDSKNEAVLKRWFQSWQESVERLRDYLPACIAISGFSNLLSRFLKADEFVQGWLAKQDAYENGVLDFDLPAKLLSDGPDKSWYLEPFERTF